MELQKALVEPEHALWNYKWLECSRCWVGHNPFLLDCSPCCRAYVQPLLVRMQPPVARMQPHAGWSASLQPPFARMGSLQVGMQPLLARMQSSSSEIQPLSVGMQPWLAGISPLLARIGNLVV